MLKTFIPILLMSSSIVFTNNYTKSVVCYDKDIGHSEIWLDPATNKYSAVTYNTYTEIINPTSVGKVIELPNTFQYFASTNIKDMFGLTPDIKYNYKADLETSAKVLNTYLLEGWELVRYEADTYAIYIELQKDDDIVRLIIYEDSIKIYDKSL